MGNTSKELAMTERVSAWGAFYTELYGWEIDRDRGNWHTEGETF